MERLDCEMYELFVSAKRRMVGVAIVGAEIEETGRLSCLVVHPRGGRKWVISTRNL